MSILLWMVVVQCVSLHTPTSSYFLEHFGLLLFSEPFQSCFFVFCFFFLLLFPSSLIPTSRSFFFFPHKKDSQDTLHRGRFQRSSRRCPWGRWWLTSRIKISFSISFFRKELKTFHSVSQTIGLFFFLFFFNWSFSLALLSDLPDRRKW